jgi:hypothetical protein
VVPEPLELVEGVVVVDEEVVVVVLLGDWQDSVTPTIVPVIGRFSAETGVPGEAFTLNVSVCPVTSLTVTTHWSAEAFGIAATPITTAAAPAAATATLSFLRLNTVV